MTIGSTREVVLVITVLTLPTLVVTFSVAVTVLVEPLITDTELSYSLVT